MKSLDAMSLVTEVKLGRVPYNIPERWRYLAWWLNFRIGEGWSENAAAVCRGQPGRSLRFSPLSVLSPSSYRLCGCGGLRRTLQAAGVAMGAVIRSAELIVQPDPHDVVGEM